MAYRSIHHCKNCGHRWKGRSYRTFEEAENAKVPRNCPNLDCGTTQTEIGMDYTSNRAPSVAGENLYVKALDETNRIVAEDYGLTNLHTDGSHQHYGDVAAPKLPPDQQRRADNMFAAPKARRNAMPRLNAGMLGRYVDPKAPDVMRAIHEAKWRPPVHIVNER